MACDPGRAPERGDAEPSRLVGRLRELRRRIDAALDELGRPRGGPVPVPAPVDERWREGLGTGRGTRR